MASGTQSIGTNCLLCSAECATCNGNAKNCELCTSGYTRDGSVCISNVRVDFIITIAKSLSSMTLGESNLFSAGLADAAQVDSDNCTFNSFSQQSSSLRLLQSGSTVSGSVSNSAGQSSTHNNLNNNAGAGSTVGGQSIQSASYTAVGSSDDSGKGVVIPRSA